MKTCSFYFVLVLCCLEIGAQLPGSNPCVGKTDCGKCIGVAASCAWCQKEGYSFERCDTLANHVLNNCGNSSDLVDPDNHVDVLQNEPVRDARDDESPDKAIQVQPQRLSLKIRPNKPATVQLTFRQAAHYPVDLYFLMDLSLSMEDDKEQTADLAVVLAQEIKNLTKNLRLGFGSFVDKVALPFTSTEPGKLKHPCAKDKQCVAPYSFKHMLSFTEDVTAFQTAVRNGEISGNLDAPEGGFDAMMQVAVCADKIGWRDVSRKLLIYSSDASYHSAGDGKLAGIVIPNDGECHLDRNGFYTKGVEMDYPSIGQMREVIRDQKINVIFAIQGYSENIYQKASDMLEGSTVGVVKDGSGNIVDLVKDNYKSISSKVELYAHNTDGVTLRYHSPCLGSDMMETRECKGLKIGESVTFDVDIEVAECPSSPALRRREITIGPVGLKDSLTIELDIICECDCQKPGQAEEKSDRCSDGNGTFACGVCACNEGRRGRFCECDGTHVTASGEDQTSNCQPQNSSLVCSGHGDCDCGECRCFPLPRSLGTQQKFSGKYCQCDDYSCDLYDGMLCGGPTRGRCQCGTCVCHADYNGTSCDCPITTKTCEAPNGAICNGNGKCTCGKCKCDKESRCYGDFCENCPSCVGNCNCNKDCVNCRLFKKGVYSEEECEDKCGDIDITEVHTLDENDNGTICQEKFADESDCTFKFSYEYGPDNKLKIKAQKVTVESTTAAPTTPTTTPQKSTGIQERSDITCGPESIQANIPRSLLTGRKGFNLVDPSCSISVTTDYVLVDFDLNSCGTTAHFTDTAIVYRNYLTDVDTKLTVPLECTYPRTRTVTSSYETVRRNISFFERGTGKLNIAMKHYTNNDFYEMIPQSEGPMRVSPGERVFVGLSAKSEHVSLSTFPATCLTTLTATPLDSSASHVIIKDGCKMDTSVTIHHSRDGEFRFSFDANALADSTGVLYVHCEVLLCENGADVTSRCSQGCVTHNGRTRREARGTPARDGHFVSGGPFLVKADDSSDGWNMVAVTTSVAVVSMLVAVVAIAVAVVSLRVRRVKQAIAQESE